MRAGIIRCMQTEDFCPGTADFKAIKEKNGVFSDVNEEIELLGFISCGGCPGKKAVLRARELVKRGADTIIFASCINKGTPIGYPCPFAKKRKISFKRIWENKSKFLIIHIKKFKEALIGKYPFFRIFRINYFISYQCFLNKIYNIIVYR